MLEETKKCCNRRATLHEKLGACDNIPSRGENFSASVDIEYRSKTKGPTKWSALPLLCVSQLFRSERELDASRRRPLGECGCLSHTSTAGTSTISPRMKGNDAVREAIL